MRAAHGDQGARGANTGQEDASRSQSLDPARYNAAALGLLRSSSGKKRPRQQRAAAMSRQPPNAEEALQ